MKKFQCIRLTTDMSNRERIRKFKNEKNEALVEYLQENAWDEDINGENAVYLILDTERQNEIVLYFGLKCGMISCPFSEDIYKLLNENHDELLDNMPSDKIEALEYIKEFISQAENKSVVNKVADTLPGLELSHFCINTAYRRAREAEGIETKGLGAYFFHQEIYPIAALIKAYIGCRFLYIFAADATENQSLVSYYENVLGFVGLDKYDKTLTSDRDVVPIMPYYDYQCKFMLMPL